MTYIPWADHRGGRLELSLLSPCMAPSANLSAARPRDGEGCLHIDGGDFHLPVWKLPEFTGTLYEAAGKPVPVILDRPQIQGTTSIFLGGYSVGRDPGAVTIFVGTEERRLTPDEAREYAAAIAERADQADAGKAETEALTDLIHAMTGNRAEAAMIASGLLRAGYRSPEARP